MSRRYLPAEVLGARTRAVMTVLASEPHRPFGSRELAERTGLTRSVAAETARRAVREGWAELVLHQGWRITVHGAFMAPVLADRGGAT